MDRRNRRWSWPMGTVVAAVGLVGLTMLVDRTGSAQPPVAEAKAITPPSLSRSSRNTASPATPRKP